MGKTSTVKKNPVMIEVNADLNAKLLGFDSAKRITRAHRRIMKSFCSPLLLGPPECEKMLELSAHMFTESEADAAQHLLPLLPLTAGQIARRCGRSVEEIMPILDNLAENKRVIYYFGKPRKYTFIPLVPGLFEMVIVSPDLSKNTLWHKRFAELFEELWDTKFILDYMGAAPPQVRYLPSQGSLSSLQTAWPSDMLEELLEPYDVFGITHCQCRTTMNLVGKGCGKPTENCTAMGPNAQEFIDRGYMRKADKKEIIEAKKIAEENGCITWMMNRENKKEGNISCSCCGCCCHAMRTITQFSTPGYISTPHFMPRMDHNACTQCGKCTIVCPMGAWKKSGKAVIFESARCIGCGLCVKSCKEKALELKVVPKAKKPERDSNTLLLSTLPAYVTTTFRVWLRRTAGI